MSEAGCPPAFSGRADAFGALRISGDDAREFLQGQVTHDMRLLQQDRGLLAAVNTPQGRVISLLRLLPYEEAIVAVLPLSMVASTLTHLRKYVLRAKVRIEDASAEVRVVPVAGDGVSALVPPASLSPGAMKIHGFGATMVAQLHGPIPRAYLVGPGHAVDAALADRKAAPSTANDWQLAQIAAGDPEVYPETSGQFVAQMLNLDLLDGISFSKGCYTGQEIIARAHHLGRVKRRMLRFMGAGTELASLARGQAIAIPPGRAGKVVELAARRDGDIEFLAVVSELGGEQSASAPDFRLAPLPVPYEVPAS
jgi:tRNA-modifying protein YgfZ